MQDVRTVFEECLAQLRAGDHGDDPAFVLLELGPEVVALAEEAYLSETDPLIRVELVHAAWQQRSQQALPFLQRALSDPVPCVWKEALDGLVVLASPTAIRILGDARTQNPSRDTDGRYSFVEWIEDALSDIANQQQP